MFLHRALKTNNKQNTLIVEIPTDNFIEAIKCGIDIILDCITVMFIVFINYAVTKDIEEHGRDRNRY